MRDYKDAVLRAVGRISRDQIFDDNLIHLAIEKCRQLGLDTEEAAALIARAIDNRPAEE